MRYNTTAVRDNTTTMRDNTTTVRRGGRKANARPISPSIF